MLYQSRVIISDGGGRIVQRGQQILFDVAYLGRVFFEAGKHELDMLHIQFQKP